ncbi:MAG: hypothetical protein Kilf2KO_30430 [Rhodospirillales bacterium]
MSQPLDPTLIKPTVYLSEAAFIRNEGYEKLASGMTGRQLQFILFKYLGGDEEDIAETERKAIEKVARDISRDFIVVDTVADHDASGLNAILFRHKREGRFYLAADGLHTTESPERWPDLDTVWNFPANFRDREGPSRQLRLLMDLVDRNVPVDQKVILTGQSLGGTLVTAASLLLGDRVEATIAYNAPNPIGWASLANGDFVRLKKTPDSIALEPLGHGPEYELEIIASEIRGLPIYQIQNQGDIYAGRVLGDDSITEGINIGTTYRLDAPPLQELREGGFNVFRIHALSATRSIADDPTYFSEETGFTDAVAVEILTGDARLQAAVESGRVQSVKLSSFDAKGGYRPLVSVTGSRAAGQKADRAEQIVAAYRDGRLLPPGETRDPTRIAAGVREVMASDPRVAVTVENPVTGAYASAGAADFFAKERFPSRAEKQAFESARTQSRFRWRPDGSVEVRPKIHLERDLKGHAVREIWEWVPQSKSFRRREAPPPQEPGSDRRSALPRRQDDRRLAALDAAGEVERLDPYSAHFDLPLAVSAGVAEARARARRQVPPPRFGEEHLGRGRLLMTSVERFERPRGTLRVPVVRPREPSDDERLQAIHARHRTAQGRTLAPTLGRRQARAQGAPETLARTRAYLRDLLVEREAQRGRARERDWAHQSEADPEIGGTALPKTLRDARRALDRFGDQNLYDLLDHTGLANHPNVIKLFHRVGQTLRRG